MRLPAGPKRLYIDRKRCEIVVEILATGERFYAPLCAAWGNDRLVRHPDFPAAPAFYVETSLPVTLT